MIPWAKIPYVILCPTKQLHTLKPIFFPLRLLTIFRQLFALPCILNTALIWVGYVTAAGCYLLSGINNMPQTAYP